MIRAVIIAVLGSVAAAVAVDQLRERRLLGLDDDKPDPEPDGGESFFGDIAETVSDGFESAIDGLQEFWDGL